MIASLESAALESAIEDGVLSTYDKTSDIFRKSKTLAGLRRGKWTSEEEAYANRLIYEFKLGLLPLTDGTTLRTFLSKLLNCDPMRISKKFVGQNCIGKQVFRRRQQDLEKLTIEQIERSRKELSELERRFLERVAQTNRTRSAPKEGRLAGFDDDGNLAPWMIQPPDDNDQLSVSQINQSNLKTGTSVTSISNFRRSSQPSSCNVSGSNQDHINDKSTTNIPANNNYVSSFTYNHTGADATIFKENPQVVIKPGKLTSSLYGGAANSIIAKDLGLFNVGNSSSRYSAQSNYYYDSGMGNQFSDSQNNNSLSGNSAKQNRSQHQHLQHPGENQSDISQSMNRTHSLDMLCSLDMVKFAQNQSLENLNSLQQSTSQSSFPWYSSLNSPGADGVYNDSNNLNVNTSNLFYESNLKASPSSASLTDFAISMWPSMNNLAAAAEAMSSSSGVEATCSSTNSIIAASPKTKRSLLSKQCHQIDPQGGLASLSNVALDELEALTSLEEEKSRHADALKSSATNSNTNSTNTGRINSSDASLETCDGKKMTNIVDFKQQNSTSDDQNRFDVGYCIDDGVTVPSSKCQILQSNQTKSSLVTNKTLDIHQNVLKILPFQQQATATATARELSTGDSNTYLMRHNDTESVNQTGGVPIVAVGPSANPRPHLDARRRNSSVEDFFMLVKLGDLPVPESDVLSESLTSKIKNGSVGSGDGDSTGKSVRSHNSSNASKKRGICSSYCDGSQESTAFRLEPSQQSEGPYSKAKKNLTFKETIDQQQSQRHHQQQRNQFPFFKDTTVENFTSILQDMAKSGSSTLQPSDDSTTLMGQLTSPGMATLYFPTPSSHHAWSATNTDKVQDRQS